MVLEKKTVIPKPRTSPNWLRSSSTTLLTVLGCLLPFSWFVPVAEAFTGRVAVVKSRENSHQWPSIRNRLMATGMRYCVIEAENWETEQNLADIRVLFLPNVERITGIQAAALESWIEQGGRVIISGPTGNLSESEVKKQLRSLFGAYWGYANSAPSTLKVTDKTELPLFNRTRLNSTLLGGVIIPTAINSQTAAVWLTQGRPPAVVLTEDSTFFGWRWGVDGVSSVELDISWLENALSRFGVTRNNQLSIVGSEPIIPCPNSAPIPREPFPILPPELVPSQEKPSLTPFKPTLPPDQFELSPELPNPDSSVPYRTQTQTVSQAVPGELSPQQVESMTQELKSLIDRFEMTLLAAEAANSGVESSLHKDSQASEKRPPTVRHSGYWALNDAKQGLQEFQQLVSQGQHEQARQSWLKARRTLWDQYPTDRPLSQAEVRAIWLDRGTLVKAKSEADLAKIFDQMAQAGINTVFLETLNASYPIYPSRVAPEQNPLTVGWDPLKVAIKLAHERNMELHAWVWIFAAANQGHNQVLEQPKDYLGPVLSRNLDWGITDKDGNYFDRGIQFKKAFLDPSNPEVRQYLLAILDEIATNYEVDGIQFDYIRYPFQDPKINQTFGYSKTSRALFKDMTGVDPIEISPGHPLWNQWTGFRIHQVDSFVATASAKLKQKRPDLILSASVFPIEKQERLFRLQQHWEDWMRQGWMDMIVLMTYALDTDNFEQRIQPLSDNSLSKSSLIIPGLRLLKVPDAVTVDQLQLVRNTSTSGFALFAAENLTPDLQRIFNRIQTPKESQPLPYRQPFKTATSRYQSLQKEWNFLLTNQKLLMEDSNLKVWSHQSNELGNLLTQLANEPSSANLVAAKAKLSQFQRQFPKWMEQYKNHHSYQVQVWLNHLDTLDKLLTYGERVVLK
ncbi:protein of unknown function DUF187 [Rippkaea orientalis PCC 8801]|uniref:Glycosyl hydrolase-like 10 domain-containing protein n=1 Tax=Rippkaea orientalis (strain PCC 8801 / RF-1) TaxID=41431 RepID=B7K1P9_RIPO1|nr:family 10 glycosylhydrolase [Rippkaea orientalis]ACK67591.1 protein of unknown function DUF187 [Rippkaea orientalis PCC 8801]